MTLLDVRSQFDLPDDVAYLNCTFINCTVFDATFTRCKMVGSHFERPRDEVFIAGLTSGILGGSTYWAEVCDFIGGDAPAVDLDAELRFQRFLVAAAERSLLRSAHDCSEGGLAARKL